MKDSDLANFDTDPLENLMKFKMLKSENINRDSDNRV